MANKTAGDATTRHGTNPQYLVEKIIRSRIYESLFWKESCFALTAEDVAEVGADLTYVGGVATGYINPSPFLCLTLKLLQIQPEKEIIVEYIQQEDFKYLSCLGAMYLRLVGTSVDCYKYLEPMLKDPRKIKLRDRAGSFELSHVDEFVDLLLNEDRVCDIILPRLTSRYTLEMDEKLDPYDTSLLDELDEDALDKLGEEASGAVSPSQELVTPAAPDGGSPSQNTDPGPGSGPGSGPAEAETSDRIVDKQGNRTRHRSRSPARRRSRSRSRSRSPRRRRSRSRSRSRSPRRRRSRSRSPRRLGYRRSYSPRRYRSRTPPRRRRRSPSRSRSRSPYRRRHRGQRRSRSRSPRGRRQSPSPSLSRSRSRSKSVSDGSNQGDAGDTGPAQQSFPPPSALVATTAVPAGVKKTHKLKFKGAVAKNPSKKKSGTRTSEDIGTSEEQEIAEANALRAKLGLKPLK